MLKILSLFMEKIAIIIPALKTNISVENAKSNIENVYKPKEFKKVSQLSKLNNDNKNIDLSLIVPVYNDELFLDACLTSIFLQKTKYKYEVICINDGSKDNSLNILKKYKEKHKNMIIVVQENKGISCSRNIGIEMARGKYIGFIDNDDIINDDYIELLLERAYLTKAEIVKSGYIIFDNKSGKIKKTSVKNKCSITNNMGKKVLEYDGYIWGGIFEKKLFKNFRFPDGYWYEDSITKNYLYRVCKKFEYISKALYKKRFHSNNAEKKLWNSGNFKAIDQYYIIKNTMEYCRNLKIEDDETLFYNLINEYGRFLWTRTKHLPSKIRKSLFVLSANDFNSISYIKIDNEYKVLIKAFEKQSFLLWKYYNFYAYYNGKK